MLQFYQEYAELPKLSQTPLYLKFNETSDLTKIIMDEIKSAKEYVVKPDSIKDILSLIRLNGDAIAKRAVDAYINGSIIVVHNKETSKIPSSLPYMIMNNKGSVKAFVFAQTAVSNINATNEYTSFMALLEAAYLALSITLKPSMFIGNRQLMLNLCNMYMLMATAPLENRLYMKGDNLVKAMLYIVAFFYRMIDGQEMDPNTINYKRLFSSKIEQTVFNQIAQDVKEMPETSFIELLNLIKKINPVRYKDLDSMYMSYFVSVCGTPLIFALENLPYLFMLVSSSTYKTGITAYNLNKTVSMHSKKIISLLAPLDSGVN